MAIETMTAKPTDQPEKGWNSMKTLSAIITVAALSLAAAPALAQGEHDMQGMPMPSGGMAMQRMDMSHMTNVTGAHDMAATVSSIDHKTGIVEADADGQKLRVHFPPDSLSGINTGDKITLHMGFTK